MKLTSKLVLGLCVATVVITLLIRIGYDQPWTGFSGKMLWDWMELLIVPIFLLAGAIYFDLRQRKLERKLEGDKERRGHIQSVKQRTMETHKKAIEDAVARLQAEQDK